MNPIDKVMRGAAHRLVVAAIVLLAVAAACRRSPPPPPDAGPSEEGLASYYAPALAGRQTASGEPYRPDALTAAHRTLPLGTVVMVSRLGDGRAPTGPQIRVRINDRGPFVGGRILDVSHAAATRLDMLRVGVVRVRISPTSAR
jgi:rare lipoprotein A